MSDALFDKSHCKKAETAHLYLDFSFEEFCHGDDEIDPRKVISSWDGDRVFIPYAELSLEDLDPNYVSMIALGEESPEESLGYYDEDYDEYNGYESQSEESNGECDYSYGGDDGIEFWDSSEDHDNSPGDEYSGVDSYAGRCSECESDSLSELVCSGVHIKKPFWAEGSSGPRKYSARGRVQHHPVHIPKRKILSNLFS